MNVNDFEKYMKNLSPELQEKVKACKNMNEMIDLAAREGIELPDEALDIVTGGTGLQSPCSDSQANNVMRCPNCKKSNGPIYSINSIYGASLKEAAEKNSTQSSYPISNYIIDCATCAKPFYAVSKDNVC